MLVACWVLQNFCLSLQCPQCVVNISGRHTTTSIGLFGSIVQLSVGKQTDVQNSPVSATDNGGPYFFNFIAIEAGMTQCNQPCYHPWFNSIHLVIYTFGKANIWNSRRLALMISSILSVFWNLKPWLLSKWPLRAFQNEFSNSSVSETHEGQTCHQFVSQTDRAIFK